MDQFSKRLATELKNRRVRPVPREVAGRLLILKFVALRAISAPPREILALYLSVWDEANRAAFAAQAEEQKNEFWEDLQVSDLWPDLSPWERQYAASTIVTMTHDDQVDASWRVESVQTLMWALGLLPELPPYDVMADHDILKEISCHDVQTFVGSARLRPTEEIDLQRFVAQLWHWRSKAHYVPEFSNELAAADRLSPTGLDTLGKTIRFTALKAAEENIIPPCIEEDFPAFGKAYRELDAHEWSEVRSITIQRHLTLNWLCGYAPGNRWDETPMDESLICAVR